MEITTQDHMDDAMVDVLRNAISHGGGYLEGLPSALRKILDRKIWARRIDCHLEQEVTFNSFTEFVTAPPMRGLNTTVEALRRLCRACDDPVALDLLDQACQMPRGGENNPAGRNQFTKLIEEEVKVNVPIGDIDLPTKKPKREQDRGNGREAALRRLRKSRPDLHERVLRKELTPHAAMVEAGFRQKKIQVPTDNVEAAMKIMLKHYDRAAILATLEETK